MTLPSIDCYTLSPSRDTLKLWCHWICMLVTFWGMGVACNTNWRIDISHCHLLLPSSGPVLLCYQWSIFLHNTHSRKLYHIIYLYVNIMFSHHIVKWMVALKHSLLIVTKSKCCGCRIQKFNIFNTKAYHWTWSWASSAHLPFLQHASIFSVFWWPFSERVPLQNSVIFLLSYLLGQTVIAS